MSNPYALSNGNAAMKYADNEQVTVEEALRRGASERLLVGWLLWRRRTDWLARKSQTAPGFNRPDFSGMRPALAQLIQPQVDQYRQQVTAEFNALPTFVRGAFADPYHRGKAHLDYYLEMRPLYYVAGYTHPAEDIFQRIRSFNLFGRSVPGGLHDVFIARLTSLPQKLDSVAPGLANRVGQAIRNLDGGFVPRYIAGTTVLSNHSYGLALDIDPGTNPHIGGGNDSDEIRILNQIVRQKTGIANFDFGSTFSTLIPQKQSTYATLMVGGMASDAVQTWLRQNLPTYKQYQAQIAQGKSAKPGSAARTQADTAKATIAGCADLQLVQKLNEHRELTELDEWANYGIQSIPIRLPLAMKELGIDWGQEYHNSKDAMHFELDRKNVIPPDSKPRPLDDLFPLMFRVTYSPDIDDLMDDLVTNGGLRPSAELDKTLSGGGLATTAPRLRQPR